MAGDEREEPGMTAAEAAEHKSSVDLVHKMLARVLTDVVPFFRPGTLLTIIARHPEMKLGSMVVGNDPIPDLIEMLKLMEKDPNYEWKSPHSLSGTPLDG